MIKEYIYLVKRKSDGKLFVTYGNFKIPGLRPSHLFKFAPIDYWCKKETPFGYVYNISSDEKYDSHKHSVVMQIQR